MEHHPTNYAIDISQAESMPQVDSDPLPEHKKAVFCNIYKPSTYEMAARAGLKITDAGYTKDRRPAVYLDGIKMAASAARSYLVSNFEFYTFNNAPCDI